jgi:26S proteasome regulatory subunit T5
MNAVLIVMQILDVNPEDENEEDGANVDLDSQRKGKCVVLKTSTRQVCVSKTIYLLPTIEGFLSFLPCTL